MKYQLIINSFGLQFVKPLIYGRGEPLQVGTKANYEETPKTLNYFPRFDTGAKDIQRKSLLGTPVFSDMILKYKDLQLTLDVVLCEVTQKKNIVSTNIVGRDGSVKEFINNADYDINIKGGFYAPMPNLVPIEEIQTLQKLISINDTLEVVSPFLDLFDVHRIVITESKINQQEGKLNTLLFDIKAKSDLELSIIIDE
ncbi:MAG: DUF6046 domain-containing protein [candidate division WOR-3 bacterium]